MPSKMVPAEYAKRRIPAEPHLARKVITWTAAKGSFYHAVSFVAIRHLSWYVPAAFAAPRRCLVRRRSP